jgi:tRNA A37 threonylcarbamoyladenosine dehydratase
LNNTGYDDRFESLRRLYGDNAYPLLRELHLCVVGLGGVGSWAVEAAARSGVGKLTIIDFDEVSPGNTNRQLPALTSTFGRKKSEVLAERVRDINPDCVVHVIDDFITGDNLFRYMMPEHGYDYVIDAIDSIKFKAAMIYHCRRNKIPIIATGGAGGCTDPTHIQVADLVRARNDALAAKVRQRLRSEYGFTRNPKRTFGIECVFSTEHKLYPKEDGTVCHEKPGVHGVHLDCRYGYGSASFVTATFGMIAVSRAINKALVRKAAKPK